MKSFLKMSSIRTRLLFAFVGIILIGFAGITVIAGGQISSAAQVDFEERLQNEIGLIAQGIAPAVDNYMDGRTDDTQVNALIQTYETQVNGTLKLYPMAAPADSHSPRDSVHNMLELDTAIQGQSILVERDDDSGEDAFYTAAPVLHDGRLYALIQLSVPASGLQGVVAQRWLELGLVFAVMTALALIVALLLARSIIQPLYRLRESAIHLSKGDFSHRVAQVGRDEIGQVALAFNEMAQQVESMLEEQRAFASNTSHELRTPLTTIRLRTEALRYDKTLDEATSHQYVEEIDEEVARLGNMIQDLTLLSRFDAGRAELGKDQVDIARFATSVMHQVKQTTDKNVEISLDLPGEPVAVNASLSHLTVVFRNLLDNAMKYTPEGGQITWKIVREGEGIRSTIRDTGRGVAAEHLPLLFERFYRVDKARSRDIPGTGLGLALAKSIVEAYGGQIKLESEGVDKGTTVTVCWPQQPTAPRTALQPNGMQTPYPLPQ